MAMSSHEISPCGETHNSNEDLLSYRMTFILLFVFYSFYVWVSVSICALLCDEEGTDMTWAWDTRGLMGAVFFYSWLAGAWAVT